MANPRHWALDDNDMTHTACDLSVGFVLAEEGDDVTSENIQEFINERLACSSCLAALVDE